MMFALLTPFSLGATGPAHNGRAQLPPQGWRHWNQWNGAISQAIIEGNIRMLADRSRKVNGVATSLADLGYNDAGIDDGWQQCGSFGPEAYRYHSAAGAPMVDEVKFPNLNSIPALAHSLNLTAGWYGNACGCVDGCCSDHCDTLECFVGDVNATLSFGFDSYKLDGCGVQRDIEFWATLFNHSIVRRNAAANASAQHMGMMLENCHDDDGMHLGPDGSGGNAPYYDVNGELWCPFHTYRTSGDARPTYGSLMNNLNSTRVMAARNLSVPGCWAYPDMLEVGVTATSNMKDCGKHGNEVCGPLSVAEAQTHFNAWAIVSSPLVLGFDLRNTTMVDLHWDTITNVAALEVNRDYAGHSGSLFAESSLNVTLHACDWKAGVTCQWPAWTAWYKPLSGRDERHSTMAILLMNNDDKAVDLSFKFSDVPAALVHSSSSSSSSSSAVGAAAAAGCTVYDVNAGKSLGKATGDVFTARAVASHANVFLTLSDC